MFALLSTIMKFGKVESVEGIDFSLPNDHSDTPIVLKSKADVNKSEKSFVGCAKWNKQELKNFYPKGTKDELSYYASQFNSIELNATFYSHFSKEQILRWVEKTPDDFCFCPKVNRMISHIKRLNQIEESVERYTDNIRWFGKKLGRCFLQLPENFLPNHQKRLEQLALLWPKDIPLAIELRNTQWFNNKDIANETYNLFLSQNITSIITDTAGRRDLLHMRLTSPDVFIRYVGANDRSDYQRLEQWVERIKTWKEYGMNTLYFFVHQNIELESPLLSSFFIQKLNHALGLNLKTPQMLSPSTYTLGLQD